MNPIPRTPPPRQSPTAQPETPLAALLRRKTSPVALRVPVVREHGAQIETPASEEPQQSLKELADAAYKRLTSLGVPPAQAAGVILKILFTE